MTILFDATAARKTNRNARRFGAGLLAYVPTTRVAHTAADEAQYLEMIADLDNARRTAARDFNEHLEERAAHSMMMDRVSSGIPLF